MPSWASLQFALALATAISCFALVIGELHMVERAEKQEWWRQFKENIGIEKIEEQERKLWNQLRGKVANIR